MNNIDELHQEANRLRQQQNYAEALSIYEKTWTETGNQYDGAGYLQCLRKQKRFEKAIPLSKELQNKFPDFGWIKNETIWTLISGKLSKYNHISQLNEIIETANEIMCLNPEGQALKTVVFKVLKSAKASSKWDIVSKWADKVDPVTLNTQPMTDEKGREGWCDQALWYNYKGKALIELDKPDDVLTLVEGAVEKFPKQKKFLLRLKALSFHKLGELDKSQECYKELCSVRKPDWWLQHEYARVVKDAGDKEKALKLMCQAAISNRKLETMVTLFREMGLLFMEFDNDVIARAHLSLSYLIRQEKGWSIPDIISNTIKKLNASIGNEDSPKTIKEALPQCRKEWENIAAPSLEQVQSKRKPKRGLKGNVLLGDTERPFCFIKDSKNDRYFCLKSDLPSNLKDKETVIFTAIPWIDKKKNTESWKAVDITRIQ